MLDVNYLQPLFRNAKSIAFDTPDGKWECEITYKTVSNEKTETLWDGVVVIKYETHHEITGATCKLKETA